MKNDRWGLLLGALLLALGCGETTQDSTGNTNWLSCTQDSECGAKTCQCGYCAAPCSGRLDCKRTRENMCIDDSSDGGATLGDGGAPLPGLPKLWGVQDPDVAGYFLAVAPDGSLWVAGGSERTYFDLSFTYPGYWLAHIHAEDGTVLFEERNRDIGATQSLALTSDRVATVTTNYVDGDRTTLIVRNAATGQPVLNTAILEEAGSILYDSQGRLVVAGSRLLEYVNGHPTSEVFLMGLDDELETTWSLSATAPQRGWSGVSSLAESPSGTLLVGASQGTSTQSNASVPWILGVRDGAIAWQNVYDSGDVTTGAAHSVLPRPGGGSLARGIDRDGTWVRALDEDGRTEWTQRLNATGYMGTVLPLPGGAYAVTSGANSCYGCDEYDGTLSVTGYDAQRRAKWRIAEPDCEAALSARVAASGTLFVLGICDWGFGLFAYELPSE